MQYDEVKQIMTSEKLMEMSLKSGLEPKEIIKHILNYRNDVELWSRAHIEYGKVLEISKQTYSDTGHYKINISWKTTKQQRDGTFSKKASTNFLNDPAILAKFKNAKDKDCIFYVSYVRNDDDGSVFRVLLDLELNNPADDWD